MSMNVIDCIVVLNVEEKYIWFGTIDVIGHAIGNKNPTISCPAFSLEFSIKNSK